MMWHERPTSWPAPSGVIVIVLVALVGALADEDGRFIGSAEGSRREPLQKRWKDCSVHGEKN
jgi:hypothetical protein